MLLSLSKIRKAPQWLRNRFGRKRFMQVYYPSSRMTPEHLIRVTTAWRGLEEIIPDILDRFDVAGGACIEFGVEFGYSAVVFSNYFELVVGVDTFQGDINAVEKTDHFEATSARLAPYKNIELHRSRYQDWILTDHSMYDFAHVDIVHTYKDTFRCGLWAAEHSKVTIFHDTESFVDVRNAVIDIGKKTGKQVFNFPDNFGLGILVPKNK